ncbi:MAG: peptidoglycan-associated lipoprotein Pal [Deltaproteobacteria bacterium]|nr:peptidoglycan-associated lipoprotein Pal [Deltaproteobacteria bacterium]
MCHKIAILTVTLGFFPLLLGATCRSQQPGTRPALPVPADLESVKDCAPERYRAAGELIGRCRALERAGRGDRAGAVLLAARRTLERGKWDCELQRAAQAASPAKERAPEEPPEREAIDLDAEAGTGLVTVYFAFDRALLSDEARQALQRNYDFLERHASLAVRIEGHCDERGSTEYNLALGERRALAVRNYLIQLGIQPERLEPISFGEERPADPGSGEDAWARNRRSELTRLAE